MVLPPPFGENAEDDPVERIVKLKIYQQVADEELRAWLQDKIEKIDNDLSARAPSGLYLQQIKEQVRQFIELQIDDLIKKAITATGDEPTQRIHSPDNLKEAKDVIRRNCD